MGEVLSGQTILFLLQRPYTDHQPGDTIVAVQLNDTVGEPTGFIDVALAENGKKSAAEQIGIARIGFENIQIISGGGR